MKGNPVLYKGLIVGVIVLFIGVGIQPAIAVTPDISDSDDCDLCPKVSKQHMILIESFLNRLEKYDDELSALCKLDPELEVKYKAIKEINDKKIWDFPIICTILEFVLYFCREITILLSNFFGGIYDVLPFNIIRFTSLIITLPFTLIFFMAIFPYALCFEIY